MRENRVAKDCRGQKGINSEMQMTYSRDFYREENREALDAARIIVPLVIELINPDSVVDVGCGLGAWLSIFKNYSANTILGVDGVWVDKDKLLIPKEKFVVADLSKPFELDRQFDLVVCLEVAEHLPCECAGTLINTLTNLGRVVLFSAAIPFQGGTHHLNEQWPDYWAKLFREKGYIVIDCIRYKVWNNHGIAAFYAQNILLYVDENYIQSYEQLKHELNISHTTTLSIVHPNIYMAHVFPFLYKLRIILGKIFPRRLMNSIKKRIVPSYISTE